MFLSKKNSSIGFGGYLSALPSDWNKLTQAQIRLLSFNLDPDLTGFVAWRTMFTYIALLKSAIPNESDIATLKKAVKQTNGLVSYEEFVDA